MRRVLKLLLLLFLFAVADVLIVITFDVFASGVGVLAGCYGNG